MALPNRQARRRSGGDTPTAAARRSLAEELREAVALEADREQPDSDDETSSNGGDGAGTSQQATRPLITMSMTATGVVSRLAGGTFGSCATFGTVGKASAPGQIPVAQLRAALAIVHPE